MKVPFLDLHAQYLSIKGEVNAAISAVIENSAFVMGKAVLDFESAFAAHHDAAHCVSTSNGTTALHLALMAMGIGPGDEVIVPVNTFIATAEAVCHCGARPVFVDVTTRDYCIDPAAIEAAITPRTRALLPVHLYGRSAPMDAVLALARTHGLKVLEDCAQAHDAEWKGRKVGTFGAAGAFSFYPGKNLGAYGEGGAVVTNDPELAARMRLLREHGSRVKYQHEVVGYNYRMEGIQGAVLGVKLPYLRDWTDRRRQAALGYRERLARLDLVLPPDDDSARHVYHLFVVRTRKRGAVMQTLTEHGVGSGIHYPVPLHLTPAFRHLGHKVGEFPVSEAAAGEILSLPMFPELSSAQLDYVADTLASAVGRR